MKVTLLLPAASLVACVGCSGTTLTDSALIPPRPIAPLPSASVSSDGPTFRWSLGPGTNGARVEVCRDDACKVVLVTETVFGDTWRPSSTLPQGVLYWRLFGVRETVAGTLPSATWLVHVGSVSTEPTTGLGIARDINGDGLADFLVQSATATYVYFGSREGAPTLHRTLRDDATGVRTVGSTAIAGDINGDGYADIVVGVSGAGPDGRSHGGAVSVYLGSNAGLSGTPNRVLEGTSEDFFGTSVTGVGDVNGDGYADVLVGVARSGPGGVGQTNEVHVYLGGRDGLTTTPQRVMEGASEDYFGASVAGVGDINRDGYADAVIGAPGASPGGRLHAGAVSVYLGSNAGLSGVPHRVLEGTSEDFFGASVAGAGDVNGDGYADVIIGATSIADVARTEYGEAYVYLGRSDGLSTSSHLTMRWHYEIVASVAGAGDVNGDGYADVIVGTTDYFCDRGCAGHFRVYLGHASDYATSLFDGWGVSGGIVSVSSAGDVNGDGRADVIAGAPRGFSYTILAPVSSMWGRAFLYLGTGEGLLAAPGWTPQNSDPGYGVRVASTCLRVRSSRPSS